MSDLADHLEPDEIQALREAREGIQVAEELERRIMKGLERARKEHVALKAHIHALKAAETELVRLEDLRLYAENRRVLAQSRLCSSCQKRPKHFDDLCKRCANDRGIRPIGKVGAAV